MFFKVFFYGMSYLFRNMCIDNCMRIFYLLFVTLNFYMFLVLVLYCFDYIDLVVNFKVIEFLNLYFEN